MALEEILALITGGLQGESKRRADNASRQRYQQEQAFKQWQVMSDLDNKRAQVEQMDAYHKAMAEAARERNRLAGENYGSLADYRTGQLGNTKMGIGVRALPYVRDQAGLGFLGQAGGFDVSGLNPDSFRSGGEVVGIDRNKITGRHNDNVDRNAIIARVIGSSDPAAAEADANAQLVASGLPPISGRLPQSAAASAGMTNAASGQMNAKYNTDPLGLGGAKIADIRAKTEVNKGLAGLFPLKQKALQADIADTKAGTTLKIAQTGNIEFDQRMKGLKLNLEALDQRWKTNPDNPQNIKAYLEFATAQRIAAREQRLALQGLVPRDYNRQAIPRKNWTPELDAQYTQMEIMARNLDGLADQAEKQLKNYMARNGMAPDGSPLVDPASNRAERTAPPKKYDANTFPPAPGYRPVPGSLPKPGAVGPQARAAGAKAGFKPQPIMKSDAAKRAGVGVQTRPPKNPKLEKGFSAITDALKGSSVNPNAGKRPR